MQYLQDMTPASTRMLSLLDELSGGCDSEFDATYDDLEREFAELRLQIGNE